MRDQEFYSIGMVGGIERNRKTFGGGSVIADQHGIVVPLLMQAGEVDHPLPRYLPLDQMNRNAFLLGADHSDDSCGHGRFLRSLDV